MTQETFVRFYDSVQRNEKLDHPVAWLYRVAGNLCISGMRQNRRRAEILQNQAVETEAAGHPDQDYEHRETLTRLRKAMQKLSARDQVLLNLYMEQRPYEEMAEIIGVRRSSVGTLLSRALSQLRTSEITGVKK